MKREWVPKKVCQTKDWCCPKLTHVLTYFTSGYYGCQFSGQKLETAWVNDRLERPLRHPDCPLVRITIETK